MEKKTYTLNLTAEELKLVYSAMNRLALHYMGKSKTWGKGYELLLAGEYNGPDYFEEQAHAVGKIQMCVDDLMLESEKEKEVK